MALKYLHLNGGINVSYSNQILCLQVAIASTKSKEYVGIFAGHFVLY